MKTPSRTPRYNTHTPTTMSALTHSSAFLSAKARVAPGAAKMRAAAAARPVSRRPFVVRAADKKKGTCCLDILAGMASRKEDAREDAVCSGSSRHVTFCLIGSDLGDDLVGLLTHRETPA
jgi:hypothetical protein